MLAEKEILHFAFQFLPLFVTVTVVFSLHSEMDLDPVFILFPERQDTFEITVQLFPVHMTASARVVPIRRMIGKAQDPISCFDRSQNIFFIRTEGMFTPVGMRMVVVFVYHPHVLKHVRGNFAR